MRLTPRLIKAVVYHETPAGWRVVQSRKRSHKDSQSGVADETSNTIRVPKLDSIEPLIVFLHEVAHVELNHFRDDAPDHAQEYEAWTHAFKKARLLGLKVPPSIVRRAKRTVRDEIESDRAKGCHIRENVRRWVRAH